MMSVSGSLTKKKVESILKRADVNLNQFTSDMQGVELVEMLEVSYFLAKKIGAKGTPTLVINNQVIPGYIPKNSILGMLK
jgi:protein-disulfide isomerase